MTSKREVSYKAHGTWVRHKRFGWVGRISYALKGKRNIEVWVVWDPGGATKTISAGGYPSSQLVKLNRPPQPWIKKGAIKRTIKRTIEQPQANDLTLARGTSNIRLSARTSERSAMSADEFDDLDDLEQEEAARAPSKGRKAKAEKPAGVSASSLAAAVGADPKTFRAWLRRQVENGVFPELANREGRERYNFGSSMTSPLVKSIQKTWSEQSHEKGAGLRKAHATLAAKKAAAPKGKGGAKRRPKAKT